MPEQCNRCRFWHEVMEFRDPNDANWGFGWCRRKPPTVVDAIVKAVVPPPAYGNHVDLDLDAVNMIAAAKWPSTHSADWCGEFERSHSVIPC